MQLTGDNVDAPGITHFRRHFFRQTLHGLRTTALILFNLHYGFNEVCLELPQNVLLAVFLIIMSTFPRILNDVTRDWKRYKDIP
jgi:hypothetical protein